MLEPEGRETAPAVDPGQVEEAIRQLVEFVEREPNSASALTFLSKLLRESGRLPAAQTYAERAVRLAPREPEILYNLALCYLAEERFEEAILFLERSIGFSPGFGAAHYAIGCAFEAIGQPWQALMALKANVEIDPFPEGFLKLGQLCLAVGELERAIEFGQKAMEGGLTSAEAHLLLADAFADTHPNESRIHLEAAMRADSRARSIFANARAKRLSRIGRLDEARALYQETIADDPRSGAGCLNLVTIQKIGEEEIPLIGRIQSLSEDRTVPKEERMYAHFALGKCFSDLGEFEVAMRHYDSANALSLLVHPYLRRFDRDAFTRNVDALIDLYSKEFVAEHARRGSRSSRPLFIVGMMRSGTTLAEQILSRHARVSAGGELAHWTFAERRIVRPGARQIHIANLDSSIEAYLRLLGVIDSNADRVTDKNPGNLLALGLIAIAFPDAHIVYMTRDPVDTALSIYTTPSRRPPEFGADRDNIVCAIRQSGRLMTHWSDVLESKRFHTVRYEDLVRTPEPVIRDLLEACELGWDDACLRPELSRSMVGTPSMWQVRQPLNTGSVGRSSRYEGSLGAFARLR